jgi:hypothetical protein
MLEQAEAAVGFGADCRCQGVVAVITRASSTS